MQIFSNLCAFEKWKNIFGLQVLKLLTVVFGRGRSLSGPLSAAELICSQKIKGPLRSALSLGLQKVAIQLILKHIGLPLL